MGAKEADDLRTVRGRMVEKRRRVAIDAKLTAEGKAKLIGEIQQQIRDLDEAIADEMKDTVKSISNGA